jgi:hypothetical protein
LLTHAAVTLGLAEGVVLLMALHPVEDGQLLIPSLTEGVVLLMALHPVEDGQLLIPSLAEVRHLDLCPNYRVPTMGSTVESGLSALSSLATNESCVPTMGSTVVESSLSALSSLASSTNDSRVPMASSTVESSLSTLSSLASSTNESCVPTAGSTVESSLSALSSLATDMSCAPVQMGPPEESRVAACSASETRLSVPTTGPPD